MFLLGTLKSKIIVAAIVATMVFLGLFFWYYKYSQNRIEKLQQENISLSTSLEITNETIDSLQKNYALITEELNRVNTEFSDIREENQMLKDRFEGHDLSKLAYSKPEWFENIINSGSEKATRCFELLSGAPLTEQERNAKTAKEFNSECPSLFRNYSVR